MSTFHNLISWPILIQMISNLNSCRNNSKFYVKFPLQPSIEMLFTGKEMVFTFEWELVKLLDYETISIFLKHYKYSITNTEHYIYHIHKEIEYMCGF